MTWEERGRSVYDPKGNLNRKEILMDPYPTVLSIKFSIFYTLLLQRLTILLPCCFVAPTATFSSSVLLLLAFLPSLFLRTSCPITREAAGKILAEDLANTFLVIDVLPATSTILAWFEMVLAIGAILLTPDTHDGARSPALLWWARVRSVELL